MTFSTIRLTVIINKARESDNIKHHTKGRSDGKIDADMELRSGIK